MSRYRGLKDGVKYSRESGYLSKKDLYRILEKYLKHYRSPKYPRSKYRGRSSGRTGRSSSRYRPRQQSHRNPAPKYKKMPKPNLSSPMRETPIRYSQEKHIRRTEIDTEQLANEIENKLDSKLTKLLLEKLEAEIEETQQKIETEKTNANAETSEEVTETQELSKLLERSGEPGVESQVEETEGLEGEAEQETIEEQVEYTRETETESPSENETEGRTETFEEADHLESYIIDEEWIDEDGLNTFFWSEPEPEQTEQEAEVSNEPTETEPANEVDVEPFETEVSDAELFLPEVELMEPEPLDEIIEPEEAGM